MAEEEMVDDRRRNFGSRIVRSPITLSDVSESLVAALASLFHETVGFKGIQVCILLLIQMCMRVREVDGCLKVPMQARERTEESPVTFFSLRLPVNASSAQEW